MLPHRANLSRILGGLLLTQWVLVAAIKTSQGRAAELLWISHVGLLLAGIALLTQTPRLARSVLILIALPHALWLGDAAAFAMFGQSPLGITAYLATATTADWLATAHHFFLLPTLIACLDRQVSWKRQDAIRAWGILIACIWASRIFSSSASNINYSYGLFGNIQHPWLDALNTAPPLAYLAIAALGTTLAIILPGSILTKNLAPKTREIIQPLRISMGVKD